MDPSVVFQLGTLVAAVGAAVVALRRAPAERKKVDAEAGAIAVEAQSRIIDDLQEEVTRQVAIRERVEVECRAEVERIRERSKQERADLLAEAIELREENERLHHRLELLELKLRNGGSK